MKKYFFAILLLYVILLSVNVEANANQINFNTYDLNEDSKNIELVLEMNYTVELDNQIILQYENQDISWEEYKNYITNYFNNENSNLLKYLYLDNYSVFLSSFSPYCFIEFKSYSDFYDNVGNLIPILNDCDFIKNIELIYNNLDSYTETNRVGYSNSNVYSLSQAHSDIGVTNSYYSGNGINVGIIDGGIITNSSAFDYSLVTNIGNTPDSHADLVASIIGGYYGIAPDANLFCFDYNYFGGYAVDAFEYALNNYNIDIFNISLGWGNSGHYDMFSKYFDCVVNSSKKTIIISAGNNGGYVTTPGQSLNAITVGNCNSSLDVSIDSSYDSLDSFVFKPDMVAPGTKVSFPHLGFITSGTSVSAPMVTGVCTLLMEEFSFLKTKPDLLKSALHLGCIMLPSQVDFFDSYAGYGIVNYTNSRNYLINNQYELFTIFPTVSSGYLLFSKTISVPSNKTLEITCNWLIDNYCNVSSVSGNATTPIFSKISINIAYQSSYTYLSSNLINSNFGYLTYTNSTAVTKTYRIDLKLAYQSYIYGTGYFAYEIK